MSLPSNTGATADILIISDEGSTVAASEAEADSAEVEADVPVHVLVRVPAQEAEEQVVLPRISTVLSWNRQG